MQNTVQTNPILAVLGAALLLAAAPLQAQKTDVIVMLNGDRVTGEIKSLDRGMLTYKTDDMGTLSVKWDKVVQVTSRSFFEVERQSGEKYFGDLSPGLESRQVVVAVREFSDTLDMATIIRIFPIEASFVQRLHGYADLGFTFQRANRNTQLTVGTQVRYRGRKWASTFQLESYLQSTQTQEATVTRNNASLSAQRFLARKWSGVGKFSLEQDTELQLARRTVLQGGAGLFVLQSNRVIMQTSGGLTWTNEQFSNTQDATNSSELFFTGDVSYFRLDSPKTDLRATLSVFPSLTESERVRLNFDGRVSHEIFKDVTVALTVFYNFDSRPPTSEPTAKENLGTKVSVGYTF